MDASAAVDMSLLLVARLKCESSAKQVQIMSEWDPHPPFGGINWSRANGKPIIPVSQPASTLEKTIALVIYDALTVFDLSGPLELMTTLSYSLGGAARVQLRHGHCLGQCTPFIKSSQSIKFFFSNGCHL